MTRSRIVGAVRATICGVIVNVGVASHDPIATASRIVNAMPKIVTRRDRMARCGVPVTMPRAIPTIGPMSGAMIDRADDRGDRIGDEADGRDDAGEPQQDREARQLVGDRRIVGVGVQDLGPTFLADVALAQPGPERPQHARPAGHRTPSSLSVPAEPSRWSAGHPRGAPASATSSRAGSRRRSG